MKVAEKRFNAAAGVSALGAFIASRLIPVSGGLWGTGIFFPLLSISTVKIGCDFFYSGTKTNLVELEAYNKWMNISRILFYLSMTLYMSTIITRDLIVHMSFLFLCLSSYFASLRCLRALHKQAVREGIEFTFANDASLRTKFQSADALCYKEGEEGIIDRILGTTNCPPGAIHNNSAETEDKTVSRKSSWMETFMIVIPKKHRNWLSFLLPVLLAYVWTSAIPSPFTKHHTFLITASVLTRGLGGQLLRSIPSWTTCNGGGRSFKVMNLLGFLGCLLVSVAPYLIDDKVFVDRFATFAGLVSWGLMIAAIFSYDPNFDGNTVLPSMVELSWAWTTGFTPILIVVGIVTYNILEHRESNEHILSKTVEHLLGSFLMCLPAIVLIVGSVICGPITTVSVLLFPWFSGPLVSLVTATGWISYCLSFTLFLRTNVTPDEVITQIVIASSIVSWTLLTLGILLRHGQPRKVVAIKVNPDNMNHPEQGAKRTSIILLGVASFAAVAASLADVRGTSFNKMLAASLVTSCLTAVAVLQQSLENGMSEIDNSLIGKLCRKLGWLLFFTSFISGWLSSGCSVPGLYFIPETKRHELSSICYGAENVRLLALTGIIGFFAQLLLVISFRRSSFLVKEHGENIETVVSKLRNRTSSECSSNSQYSCDSQCSECLRERNCVSCHNDFREHSCSDKSIDEYGNCRGSECVCAKPNILEDDEECEPVIEPPPAALMSVLPTATGLNDKIINENEDAAPVPAIKEIHRSIIWVDQLEENRGHVTSALVESIYDTESDKLDIETHSSLNSGVSLSGSDTESRFDSSDESDNESLSSFSSNSSSSSSSSDSSGSSLSSLSEIELLERQIGNPQGACSAKHSSDGDESLGFPSSRSSSSSLDISMEEFESEKNPELEVESYTTASLVRNTPPKIPPRTYVLPEPKLENTNNKLVFG